LNGFRNRHPPVVAVEENLIRCALHDLGALGSALDY
jgi:hypothetical protein